MPAGGLFSTAHHTALFCQMLLNRGELHGKRILSEAAVAELTKPRLRLICAPPPPRPRRT